MFAAWFGREIAWISQRCLHQSCRYACCLYLAKISDQNSLYIARYYANGGRWSAVQIVWIIKVSEYKHFFRHETLGIRSRSQHETCSSTCKPFTWKISTENDLSNSSYGWRNEWRSSCPVFWNYFGIQLQGIYHHHNERIRSRVLHESCRDMSQLFINSKITSIEYINHKICPKYGN